MIKVWHVWKLISRIALVPNILEWILTTTAIDRYCGEAHSTQIIKFEWIQMIHKTIKPICVSAAISFKWLTKWMNGETQQQNSFRRNEKKRKEKIVEKIWKRIRSKRKKQQPNNLLTTAKSQKSMKHNWNCAARSKDTLSAFYTNFGLQFHVDYE